MSNPLQNAQNMGMIKVGHDRSLSGYFGIKSVLLLCLVSEANAISSNVFSNTPAFAFVEIELVSEGTM